MLILQQCARLAGRVPRRLRAWACWSRSPFLLQPAALFEPPPKPVRPASEAPKDDKAGWSLLLSGPILLNLLFFVMITFSTTGVQNYSVVALGEAFGTPLGVANTALTANLMLSAFGVLVGGLLAARVDAARMGRGRLVPRHRVTAP